MTHRLEPETLVLDADGVPWSHRYQDRYTSRAGGAAQARHVFLGGNDLPAAWAGRRQFVILETGFGLGSNFLASWEAWQADPQRPEQLHFVSIERHPLRAADLAGHADGGAPALRRALAARWPLLVPGLHRLDFADGCVRLTLGLGDAANLLPQVAAGVDAFYLDGFAPDRNPRMWDAALIRALARLARPGATLATYTSAGSVRTALADHGFAVQRRPGFAGKRDMLTARYAPRWRMRRHEPPAAATGERRAVVVGAGLAGTSCALALCQRGWQVQLLDRADAAAAGASGLPAGLLYPLLSADDNLASRLSRAAFLHARRVLDALDAPARGGIWAECGVFHALADPAAQRALGDALARAGFPAAFAQMQAAAMAAPAVGALPRHDGLWFAGAGAVDAGRWCRQMIAAAGQSHGSLAFCASFAAVALQRDGQRDGASANWTVVAADGRRCRAPVVILANAGGLPALLPGQFLPLQELGGRLSLLAPPALAHLRAAVSGDGYCIPPVLGQAVLGASYEDEPADGHGQAGAPGADDRATREAHAANRQHLNALLSQPPAVHIAGSFAARRCISVDRLPLAGAIADLAAPAVDAQRAAGAQLADLERCAGLYCLAALGSRGITLATLLAEQLAAQICGEPQPLEKDLADAVDPARFLLRQRRGRYRTPSGAAGDRAPGDDGTLR